MNVLSHNRMKCFVSPPLNEKLASLASSHLHFRFLLSINSYEKKATATTKHTAHSPRLALCYFLRCCVLIGDDSRDYIVSQCFSLDSTLNLSFGRFLFHTYMGKCASTSISLSWRSRLVFFSSSSSSFVCFFFFFSVNRSYIHRVVGV